MQTVETRRGQHDRMQGYGSHGGHTVFQKLPPVCASATCGQTARQTVFDCLCVLPIQAVQALQRKRVCWIDSVRKRLELVGASHHQRAGALCRRRWAVMWARRRCEREVRGDGVRCVWCGLDSIRQNQKQQENKKEEEGNGEEQSEEQSLQTIGARVACGRLGWSAAFTPASQPHWAGGRAVRSSTEGPALQGALPNQMPSTIIHAGSPQHS